MRNKIGEWIENKIGGGLRINNILRGIGFREFHCVSTKFYGACAINGSRDAVIMTRGARLLPVARSGSYPAGAENGHLHLSFRARRGNITVFLDVFASKI